MQPCQSHTAVFRSVIIYAGLIVAITAMGCSRSPGPQTTPATFFSSFSSPFECDIPTCWNALQPILLKRGDKVTALAETRTDAGARMATSRATTTDGSEFLIILQTDIDSTTHVKLETSRPALIETMQAILRVLDESLEAEG